MSANDTNENNRDENTQATQATMRENNNDATARDETIRREMRRRSRRSFLVGGAAAVAGVAGWEWLRTRPQVDGIESPLRRMLQFNERVWNAYYSPSRLAPTFDRQLAREPRVNGMEGMADDLDPKMWHLQLIGVADAMKYPQYRADVSYQMSNDDDVNDSSDDNQDDGDNSSDGDDSDDSDDGDDSDNGGGNQNQDTKNNGDKKGSDKNNKPAEHPAADEMKSSGLLLSLDDIKKLPKVEMTTELKCIEGWSVKVNWAGARLADFIAAYAPPTHNNTAPDVKNRPQDLVRYISMETPDGGYYVGLEMMNALHPQTLLCYEMNGQPLNSDHGAPLRLVTPLKYGIKHIKRIGRITFTDTRPKDFWAEQGYDWDAGH